MGQLVPACVWRVTPDVVVALDGSFGVPVDAYVNGSQVWLRDDGPGEVTLEWRLHPIGGFTRPRGTGTYELFETVAQALALGEEPVAPLAALWDGLEAFPAYGDEVEPALLAGACSASLGVAPDACGLVDHQRIGEAWERARGAMSITDALLAELRS